MRYAYSSAPRRLNYPRLCEHLSVPPLEAAQQHAALSDVDELRKDQVRPHWLGIVVWSVKPQDVQPALVNR